MYVWVFVCVFVCVRYGEAGAHNMRSVFFRLFPSPSPGSLISYVHTNRDVDVWTIEIDECVILLSLCICYGTSDIVRFGIWAEPTLEWSVLSVYTMCSVCVFFFAWWFYSTFFFFSTLFVVVGMYSHVCSARTQISSFDDGTGAARIIYANGLFSYVVLPRITQFVRLEWCAPKRWWRLSVWTLSTLFYLA